MKRIFPRAISLLLTVSLLAALALPALASEALGDGLTASDTLLNYQTQLSTNVFWSSVSSDYRTENLITYTPNSSVTPIVTYGGVLTDRSTVSNTARALEEQGRRVVAGINGDFYNVNNGLPIGIVVTQGQLRSSDGGYHAIGFRADGTAVLGKPGVTVGVHYTAQDGTGEPLFDEAGNPLLDEAGNPRYNGTGQIVDKAMHVTAFNKARTEDGVYLYTYDFNASHTTGSTQPGVDVICTVQSGAFSIGQSTALLVDRVEEGTSAPVMAPNQVVLTANGKASEATLAALRAIPAGTVLTVNIAADPAWNGVDYAVGSLYSLVENGAVASGLPSGVNPRTAVGQRYDGSLIFYTIDGRKSGHSIGATMAQVAQRLIELGCVTALCMDGGGSTSIVATQPTELSAKRINIPSDGGERAVSNQIFLVATNQPSGVLDHFHVSADNAYVLAGSSAVISAAAIDTNYIPMNGSYDLYASAGTMAGNVLTTPLEGGEITVTAQGSGGQGSTVVHAITAPDGVAVRNEENTIISSLSVAPGASVQLHGSAAWHHLPLKADPAAFSWSVEGDIGAIDENGLFTATALGSGKITVSAGTQSESIDVTVATKHLETLEDFEGETTILRGSGEGISFSLNRDGNYVRMGRGSGKVEYDLTGTGTARWNATSQPAVLNAPYTGLNLWVNSNGSGNSLSLLYSVGDEEVQSLPLATLDVSGWKQVSVNGLSQGMTIRGLEISGTGTGTIYLDQITATFDSIADNDPPVITAELNQEDWTVTGTVSDAVDGILPASAVAMTFNGSPMGEYDPATGRFSIALPGPGESGYASRVTITARDHSGNIGRASVDTPPYQVEHVFTDTAEYWGADYCDFLYANGISGGYSDGTFRPDDRLTRLSFSVMLYNALKLDPVKYVDVSLPFADLGSIPVEALPAIKALYKEGVVTGTTKNGKLCFDPEGSLTRAQAAAMIGRSQEKGYATPSLAFTDAASIPSYAEFYVRTMVAQGILSGYADGSFRPQANITRGQMAKILYTML